MKRSALIVEDEPLAVQNLREMVSEVPWLSVVGEANDGKTAVERIDALRPDLVFLDVRMPELSGLEVLDRIEHDPVVVFTTAYDRYAVTAFELGAIDYLVKPFGRKRLLTTLERVRQRFSETPAGPSALERARSALGTHPLARLFASKGHRIIPIGVEAITEIRACDDYSEVIAGGEAYLLQLTLTDLESRLDGEKFIRVHRSHLVNLDHLISIEPCGDRRLELTLKGGQKIVASRGGSLRLKSLIR